MGLIVGWSMAVAAFLIVAIGSVALWPGSGPEPAPLAAGTSAPPASEIDSCLVTVPGDNPFAPPAETPEMSPPDPDAVWFGTPALWTSLHPDGELWSDLPVAADGTLTQKTFWWSRDFVAITDPVPAISFTAKRLDGPGATMSSAITFGGNPEQGVFLVVGFQIPEEGCWEIEAEYSGTTLAYVVRVGD